MTDHPPILMLAPLQGVTDVVFRQTYARHFSGIDHAVAPFISTMSSRRLKPSRLKDVDPILNAALPVIPQILGNNPDDFIYLANYLFEMGYTQVNWNLGCPHSKIAKKMRGSGLLAHPDKIDACLSRIIPAMKPSLSVKIRLGRQEKSEIGDLIAMFNTHTLDEIILHPRTGVQMYAGAADVDAFETAMNASTHPMVYNGDIVDTASWEKIRCRFPRINRFMIGRGILSNPFLPEQIKGAMWHCQQTAPPDQYPESGSDQGRQKRERLKTFHADLFDSYQRVLSGPGHLIGRMKGVWSYLGSSFEHSEKPLKKLLKSKSEQEYLDQVDKFWAMNLTFSPDRT